MKPFLRQQTPDSPELKASYARHAEELQRLPEDQPVRFLQLMALLGVEAFQLNALEDAKAYLKNALQLAQHTQQAAMVFHLSLQLGTCCQYLEDLEGADTYFQQALKMTTEDPLKKELGQALVAWGKLLAEQGKYSVAQSCFERAIAFEKAQTDPREHNVEDAENALALLEALGPIDDKGYAVSYTEISHIEVPEITIPSDTE